jgi:hypothetical protein
MDPNANIAEQVQLAHTILRVEFDADEVTARLAELVLALDEWRSKGGFAPAAAPASTDETDETKWNFWLPDSDRSCGWTNHGYVLQFVCAGNGATPEEAWRRRSLRARRLPADPRPAPGPAVRRRRMSPRPPGRRPHTRVRVLAVRDRARDSRTNER